MPTSVTPEPGAAPHRLTVIADDFGIDPAIDRAVLVLAQQGRLSGTSVLALGAHWATSAAWLSQVPQLQVGLHVDIPPGHDALGPALWQAWRRQLPGLAEHLHAQFEAFDRHRAEPPDYVDGHRHVHQWPVLRELIEAQWLQRYGRPPRWARITRPAPGVPGRFKAEVVYRLGGQTWAQQLQRLGWAHHRDFLGVYDFAGGPQRYGALLQQWLACAQDGSLMMCHPADAVVPGDAIAAARVDEFHVWQQPEVAQWLAQAGCRVVQGRDPDPGRGMGAVVYSQSRPRGQ